MNSSFTARMRKNLEGERLKNASCAYELSCEMKERKFQELIVQNHCTKAANWNHPLAQTEVGLLALFGYHIDFSASTYQNIVYATPESAVNWFKLASNGGSYIATYLYGKCYQNGIFVDKDDEKANALLGRAIKGINEDDILLLNAIIDYYMGKDTPLVYFLQPKIMETMHNRFRIWDHNTIVRYMKAS